MWGTLYGFLALDRDGKTIRGITFYDQKETPGLGGEIGNPKWQALWVGRHAYDANWEPKIAVIKGNAGPPAQDPHRVDAISGATITSNGVARLVGFWLSNDGYGPYLKRFREGATQMSCIDAASRTRAERTHAARRRSSRTTRSPCRCSASARRSR